MINMHLFKRSVPFLALIILYNPMLMAQEKSHEATNYSEVDVASAADSAIIKDRYLSRTLLSNMEDFADPSTVSGWMLDWHITTEQEYQKKNFLLHADIIPHFFLGGKRYGNARRGFFAAEFTPQFKVRMFANDASKGDTSIPVRTPSYLPGGTVYYAVNLPKLGLRWDTISKRGISFT